jgi:hypothetical protein
MLSNENYKRGMQDRLYEIDKSWKNNLMIYGVPCAENIEEDSIITEEKVIQTYYYLMAAVKSLITQDLGRKKSAEYFQQLCERSLAVAR